MNINKSLLGYITYGVKLEKLHKKMSLVKRVTFIVFIIFLFFQAINFLNNGQYFFMNFFKVKISFILLVTMFTVLYLACLVYAFKLSNAWIVTVMTISNVIVAVILLIIIDSISSLEFDNKKTLLFFIALITNNAVALIIHLVPFYLITSKYFGYNPKGHRAIRKKFTLTLQDLTFFISPDYFYAKLYKSLLTAEVYNKYLKDNNSFQVVDGRSLPNIREEKNRVRYFILFSNWINVILTTLVVSYLLLINLRDISYISWYEFFFFLILLRLISRSFEVIYAFFKDVVRNRVLYIFKSNQSGDIIEGKLHNNWKNSTIRRPERISLAVHSYIELMLLFAIYYFIIVGSSVSIDCDRNEFKHIQNNSFLVTCSRHSTESTLEEVTPKSFFDLVLYSTSVTFFNVSFDHGNSTPVQWKIAHVLQVLISFILIVLSLANYLSLSDEMSEDDENEFLLIKFWESENPRHQAVLRTIIKAFLAKDLK